MSTGKGGGLSLNFKIGGADYGATNELHNDNRASGQQDKNGYQKVRVVVPDAG